MFVSVLYFARILTARQKNGMIVKRKNVPLSVQNRFNEWGVNAMSQGKKKITLKDIAAYTGLSVNTVSRVLNKKPYYTKEVEEKVTEACRALGYIADRNASGLRSGSTRTIAIVFDDLVNPFYSYTTDIISRIFEEHGYNTIIFSNNARSPYLDYDLIRNVLSRKPDGILSFLEPAEDTVAFIRDTGIPFVIFGRDGAPYSMRGVDADEEFGGKLAGQHLVSRGYKNLAYIGSWHDVKVCLDRQRGFADALESAGLTLDPSHIFYIREALPDEIVDKLIADGVDGLFCYNDIIAFVMIEAIERRGLVTGRDYGIVGYDNIQQMLRMPRFLTTIDVNVYEFARAGAEVMLALLAGEEKAAVPLFRETHVSVLIEGRSTPQR